MTNVNGTRIERLDEAADKIVATSSLSTELFALVDELNAQPDLGRALTDPALEAEGRGKLAGALLGKRLSGPTVDFVVQALALDWASGREFTSGLGRQAIRIALRSTDADQVRTELNVVRETLATHDELRVAMAGHTAGEEARAKLVDQLLGDKVDPVTAMLVGRAVRDGEHVQDALWSCMELASQVLGRILARVTVARPLPAYQMAELGEQLRRLYGQPVDMAEHVDPSVLGGVRVELGDDVIDGTVASKLSEAQREMA